MSLALTNRLEILQERSAMLAKARSFFSTRSILEVDVPILSRCGSVDAHIDLIEAICMGEKCFLHSSPEYGMKRLLSENIGDIYQLSHVFRDKEKGDLHNPEFMMCEWYRIGISLDHLIEETLDFFALFFDFPRPCHTYLYQDLFIEHMSDFPESGEVRNKIFAFEIEPNLGRETPAIVQGFLPEDAALSSIGSNGLAMRFEIFYKGMELANGYQELVDSKEQEKRFVIANAQRERLKKEAYPIDEKFLAALENGIANCCGVAVGFDRLMMIRSQAKTIDEVQPFSWERN